MEWFLKNKKRQNKIIRKRKEKVEVQSYFVFKSTEGFLVKLLKHGFSYSYQPSYSTKKVKTEKEAETYLKKLKERFLSNNWEYVEVREKALL